jgi:hypothetical protein
MPEPGVDPSSGISSGDALIRPERQPACRRRELRPGFRTERENLHCVHAGGFEGRRDGRSHKRRARATVPTRIRVTRAPHQLASARLQLADKVVQRGGMPLCARFGSDRWEIALCYRDARRLWERRSRITVHAPVAPSTPMRKKTASSRLAIADRVSNLQHQHHHHPAGQQTPTRRRSCHQPSRQSGTSRRQA